MMISARFRKLKSAMHRTGLRILKTTVGIQSNTRLLLPKFPLKIEVKSLLTDFHDVAEIPFSSNLDGQIVLTNATSAAATFSRSEKKAVVRGPLVGLERRASDLRFSLWGNQGFLYRFILYLLEAKHRIFSLHACGLYDEKRNILYIIAGGAGSGKTVYLLSGLLRGLKLFSTETVHFRSTEKGLVWFKGSLVDNVRLGTLVHDFPQFLPRRVREIGKRDLWQKKIALNLTSYQFAADTLSSPRLIILFPRIEEGRKDSLVMSLDGSSLAAKTLFDNISQKIAESVVLYDRMAIPGFDDRRLAEARLRSSYRLVRHPSIIKIASVLSSPAECWKNLPDGVQRRRR